MLQKHCSIINLKALNILEKTTSTLKKSVLAAGILTLLCAILLFSCKKADNSFPKEPVLSGIPGMGDSKEDLQGTPFNLPASIEIIGGLRGYDFGSDTTTPCQEVGNGSMIEVGMVMVNHGNDTILALPAGLTFKSLKDEDQNGILVQKQLLHFNAGDTCFVVIYAFCVNVGRHFSSADSRYEIGPVTNAEQMKELIDLLKNKKIDDNGSDVQYFVWDISDSDGLTDEDRAAISQLPNL